MSGRYDGRQHATPILIDHLDATGSARALERVTLAANASDDGGTYGEGWLQELIHRFPQTLPIAEIEPGLSCPTSVCMELPTAAGNVDNLFATAGGDLVLAECKLWRNPEARREVVAQIIDYAHCMASWRYEDLEKAVSRGIAPGGTRPSGRLYEIIGGDREADEASFVDAVVRNLRLGRMLLLIVGDGIREGVETLADYLQSHPGFRFSLGVVEVAVHRIPDASSFVVQPRVLARTVNIERAVVRIEGGQAVVTAPPSGARSPGGGRRTSITEEHLFEHLAAVDPTLPERLRSFLEQAATFGVFYELNGSLMLKWQDTRGNKFNLSCIYPNGDVYTRPVNWMADGVGKLDLAHDYLERVAALIQGTVRRTEKAAAWYVSAEGKRSPSIGQLLDASTEWLAAIEQYMTGLAQAAEAEGAATES